MKPRTRTYSKKNRSLHPALHAARSRIIFALLCVFENRFVSDTRMNKWSWCSCWIDLERCLSQSCNWYAHNSINWSRSSFLVKIFLEHKLTPYHQALRNLHQAMAISKEINLTPTSKVMLGSEFSYQVAGFKCLWSSNHLFMCLVNFIFSVIKPTSSILGSRPWLSH